MINSFKIDISFLSRADNKFLAQYVSTLNIFILMLPFSAENYCLVQKLTNNVPFNYTIQDICYQIREVTYIIKNDYINVTFIR